MPSDFNCVKIHPWVLQVTLHLPSAGISEVVNRSGTSEENIHKHWQIATKTCTNHHWRELGFAGIHSPALWGQQGQILGEHWCTPRRAEGPHTHRARSSRGGSPSGVSSAPAQDRLSRSCQHNCLGSLPARQMLLLEKWPVCQLPKALPGCDLHPGRERGGGQEGYFITQQAK